MNIENIEVSLLLIWLILLIILHPDGFGLFDLGGEIIGFIFAIATLVLLFAVAVLNLSLYIISIY